MLYTPLTKKALALCFAAHKDQTDKSGLPYVFHPFHLAQQMETEETTVVALLHDVVEDTDYTLEQLAEMGFGEDVIAALKLLTHDESVPYMDYVRAIKKNPIAKAVKLADLRHNSDLSRLDTVDEAALARREKYQEAIALLEAPDAPEKPLGQRLRHWCKEQLPSILGAIIMIFASLSLVITVLSSSGVLPETANVKRLAKDQLKKELQTEGATVSAVRFDPVKTQKFKTRGEDPVGYFAYMDQPVTVKNPDETFTEYASHFDWIRAKVGAGYQPESDFKWAYTLTGRFEATFKDNSTVSGTFTLVYVKNLTDNCWYCIACTHTVN